MKIQQGVYAACVAVCTLLACWLAADYTATTLVGDRLAQAVSRKEAAAEHAADATARAIDTDMTVLRAIPLTLSETDVLHSALSAFSDGAYAPGAVPRADDLLRKTGAYLGADRIWLLDGKGQCVASSDRVSGTLSASRTSANLDYVRQALMGQNFEGFRVDAAGKPELYFSAPVYRDGLIKGVVAVKVAAARLRHWVDARESLVIDRNGIVIVANRRAFEMRSIPNATVTSLPAGQRDETYRQSEFSLLPIGPYARPPGRANAWVPQPLLNRMVSLGTPELPYVMRAKEIGSGGVKAIAIEDVDAWPRLMQEHDRDNLLFFFLYLAVALIMAMAGWIFWRERNLGRLVGRAGKATQSAESQQTFESNYDELTGSLTRGYFLQCFEQMLASVRQQGVSLGLIMVGFEHFKELSGHQGHAAGDQVLCRFVLACSSVLRGNDIIGRISSESFAILLPGAGERDALRVAERIQISCRRVMAEHAGDAIEFTPSFGITGDKPEDTPAIMVERAGIALSRARETGHERCWVF